MIDFQELAVFKLSKGAHSDAESGVCAMEAVAWLEGLPHSDAPECTCPVIAAFVRTINDRMLSDVRQGLVAYLPRLVGTVSKEHEQERAEYLAWQAIRVFAPAALRSVGLDEHAKRLNAAMTLAEGVEIAREASAAYAYAGGAAPIWPLAFKALDGVLAIGPSGSEFSKPVQERVAAYRELIGA